MNRLFVLAILAMVTISARAVEDGQVQYMGGTVPGVSISAVGHLDLTSETEMKFESQGGKFAVPYKAIESFEYSEQLTHHLGVMPAIAVGLTRTRKHRHYFRIVYRDEANVAQIVVLEVPKQMPHTLQAVLDARAPGTCTHPAKCGPEN